MFLDQIKINLRSGTGGSGAVSFRREKYVPRGGPDGGDGGRGGHIFFRVDPGLTTLSWFRYHRRFQAGNGQAGSAKNSSGKEGVDLYLTVPLGTIIKDAASQEVLADLSQPEAELKLLQGGRGGRGNSHFANATRQAPRFAEQGELGRELEVELELKLLADVALIGFPNAGKSSLLARISAARPKVADYPFTTLVPNLGVVDHKGRSFVAVDVPGLIEGAHQGIGLGDRFLRHIERTRVLVHLLDLATEQTGRDPYLDYLQTNRELELYNPQLAVRPQVIVANKIDLTEAPAALTALRAQLAPRPVLAISAVSGAGITELLDQLIAQLAALPMESVAPITAVPQRERIEPVTVVKEQGVFVVKNSALVRRVARFDLSNDESVASLQKMLAGWGIEPALRQAGISNGDQVRIGDFEFTYRAPE